MKHLASFILGMASVVSIQYLGYAPEGLKTERQILNEDIRNKENRIEILSRYHDQMVAHEKLYNQK